MNPDNKQCKAYINPLTFKLGLIIESKQRLWTGMVHCVTMMYM